MSENEVQEGQENQKNPEIKETPELEPELEKAVDETVEVPISVNVPLVQICQILDLTGDTVDIGFEIDTDAIIELFSGSMEERDRIFNVFKSNIESIYSCVARLAETSEIESQKESIQPYE
jgi:hypothetical protein